MGAKVQPRVQHAVRKLLPNKLVAHYLGMLAEENDKYRLARFRSKICCLAIRTYAHLEHQRFAANPLHFGHAILFFATAASNSAGSAASGICSRTDQRSFYQHGTCHYTWSIVLWDQRNQLDDLKPQRQILTLSASHLSPSCRHGVPSGVSITAKIYSLERHHLVHIPKNPHVHPRMAHSLENKILALVQVLEHPHSSFC